MPVRQGIFAFIANFEMLQILTLVLPFTEK